MNIAVSTCLAIATLFWVNLAYVYLWQGLEKSEEEFGAYFSIKYPKSRREEFFNSLAMRWGLAIMFTVFSFVSLYKAFHS